jgi:LacI family transcriptional regulator
MAAKLNYRPNRVARNLATGRSHTIGLIVSDIRNPFFAEVARGAEDAACSAGCELVLCNSDLDAAKQVRYIQSLLDKRVDGILMHSVGGLDRPQQENLSLSGIPVVLLNRPRSASNFSTVTADNDEGGFLAGEYLMKLGHRRIAYLSGPPDHGNMRDRGRGLIRALAADAEANHPVILRGPHNFRGGYDMGNLVLTRLPDITAIFAANDIVAFGVIRAILEAGLSVPGDISVIGFDNVEVSLISHPPLTTVHQPKYEMGRAAVDMIVQSAGEQGTHLPEHRTLGVKLMERESCAPPRARSTV